MSSVYLQCVHNPFNNDYCFMHEQHKTAEKCQAEKINQRGHYYKETVHHEENCD